jgi:hypothetical protein
MSIGPTIRLRNAFPEAQPKGYQEGRGDKPGMTFRQYYAGQALIGLIARWGDEYTPEGFAQQAVAMSDALCEELAK